MVTILNAFIIDQSWRSSCSRIFIKQVQDGLRKITKDLKYIASTTNMADDQNAQVPGFIEWQTAHAQLCLQIHNLPYLNIDSVLCPDGDNDVQIEGDFARSCWVSDDQRNDLKKEDAQESDSFRAKYDSERTITEPHAGDNAESIVLSLITSSQYEVRELALGALLDGNTMTFHTSPEDPQQTNLWSKVALSGDIFHALVAMVIHEEMEDRPACVEKALSLLSIHPLSKVFPWTLPGGITLSCLGAFNKIMTIASLDNDRDETTCAALGMLSSLIPLLYAEVQKHNMDEAVSKALHNWTDLLECCSQPEQSIQSRAMVANTLSDLAGQILVDSRQVLGFDIPLRFWGIVMSLLQDDDQGVQEVACHCIQQAIKVMPTHVSISGAFPVADFQSTLALKIGLSLMSSLYANACPRQYLQTLIGWLIGTQEHENIMGTHNASLDSGKDEQVPEDRLFDKGEANTNFESLLFGKAILEELLALAEAMTKHQTSVQLVTDHKDVLSTTDHTNDQSITGEDANQSAGQTKCPGKEIDTNKSYQLTGHILSHNAQGFDSQSGHRGVCPIRLEHISLTNKQDLVTASHEIMGKMLPALERFLDNMSVISLTTPYLDTIEFETKCVRCWGFLAAIQGLGGLVKSHSIEQCEDNAREQQLKLMQLVFAKFGGDKGCNPLIRKVADDIKQL